MSTAVMTMANVTRCLVHVGHFPNCADDLPTRRPHRRRRRARHWRRAEHRPPSRRAAPSPHPGGHRNHADPNPVGRRLAVLTLGALGVVHGDIGSSPLYALRECCSHLYGLTPTPANVKAMPTRTSYFLERERLLPHGTSPMARWRTRVFVLMSRNARSATEFFGLPSNRVVEPGAQIEF